MITSPSSNALALAPSDTPVGISNVDWNTPVLSPVSSNRVGFLVNAAVLISSELSASESHSTKANEYDSAVDEWKRVDVGDAKRAELKKKIAARPAVKPSDVGRSGQYNEYDPAVDEELTIPQAQEFKVASMKQALAQVWGLDEWKNTKEDHQEKKKGGKTDTGGKMAEVEIDPELKDKK